MNCASLGPFVHAFCGNPDNPSECTLANWLCDGIDDCSKGLDESLATCEGGTFLYKVFMYNNIQ